LCGSAIKEEFGGSTASGTTVNMLSACPLTTLQSEEGGHFGTLDRLAIT